MSMMKMPMDSKTKRKKPIDPHATCVDNGCQGKVTGVLIGPNYSIH